MASVLPLKLDPRVGVDGGGMKDRFIKTTYSRIFLLKKLFLLSPRFCQRGAVGQMRSKPRTTSYLPLRQPLLKSPYLFNRCLMKIEIQSVRLFQPIYLFIYTTKIKKIIEDISHLYQIRLTHAGPTGRIEGSRMRVNLQKSHVRKRFC